MTPLTRRSLLKFAGAGATLAALPRILSADTSSAPAPAAAPFRPAPNSGIHRFRLGDWEATAFAAGIWDVPQPHPMFAPQATPEQFRESLEGECLPADKIRLYFNILLLRTGRETLLIDSGFGPTGAAPFHLLDNLAAVGLTAADITGVFLTHAHGDHMGGLLDASGKPVFTRAEHFCTAEELAFWTSSKPDFSRSALDPKSRDGQIAGARRTFDSLRFTTLKADTRLPEGVQTILAPGHTPGHMTLRFESKGEMLYHMADIAHHFALMLPHPDWTVAFDNNPDQAAATRKSILARLAGEKIKDFGYHMPFPGLGRIQAAGAGYRWVPRTWDPAL